MAKAILRAENFSAGYGKPLFSEAEIVLESGRVVSLVGPNGTGKSTVLRCFAGLLRPLSGNIFLCGRPIESFLPRERAKLVASVFTQVRIPFGMKCREFVSLGRIPYSGWLDGRSKVDSQSIDASISSVGMEAFADRRISDLSDGERSRVFLARAFASEPKVLLLDEPTAFLDIPNILGLFRLLKKMAREKNVAVLLSTHHLDYALKFSDRVLAFDGLGNIREDSPDALARSGFLAWAGGESLAEKSDENP